jgi:hypothetical protein
MNAEQLIQSVQYPASLSALKAEELIELTNKYPWFGTAQVLSAIKQQQSNLPQAKEQIQKALLFVHHPLWLQQQINRFTLIDEQEEIAHVPVATAAAIEEVYKEEITIAQDETDAAIDADVLVNAINEQETNVLLQETETVANAEVLIDAVDEQETIALLEETEISVDAELLVEAADAQETDPNFKPLSDILKQEVPADAKLSFEPLHAVDYFASQGIRLKEERLGNDKLGQQLKTFTQWLKTLKKVNPEDELPLDETAEKQLVQMAGGSNKGEEIVTEAMAHVLEQQGKAHKAVELYQKLSLLHPEKSAYFASQIQRLKQ